MLAVEAVAAELAAAGWGGRRLGAYCAVGGAQVSHGEGSTQLSDGHLQAPVLHQDSAPSSTGRTRALQTRGLLVVP